MDLSAMWLDQAAADVLLDCLWTEAREASSRFPSSLSPKQSGIWQQEWWWMKTQRANKKYWLKKNYFEVCNNWNFHVCNIQNSSCRCPFLDCSLNGEKCSSTKAVSWLFRRSFSISKIISQYYNMHKKQDSEREKRCQVPPCGHLTNNLISFSVCSSLPSDHRLQGIASTTTWHKLG